MGKWLRDHLDFSYDSAKILMPKTFAYVGSWFWIDLNLLSSDFPFKYQRTPFDEKKGFQLKSIDFQEPEEKLITEQK